MEPSLNARHSAWHGWQPRSPTLAIGWCGEGWTEEGRHPIYRAFLHELPDTRIQPRHPRRIVCCRSTTPALPTSQFEECPRGRRREELRQCERGEQEWKGAPATPQVPLARVSTRDTTPAQAFAGAFHSADKAGWSGCSQPVCGRRQGYAGAL